MIIRKVTCFFLLTVFMLFLGSCSRPGALQKLSFASTPVISTTERFALLIEPYISMRDQPGDKGITISHGRRGEIFPVQGKRIIRENSEDTIWINVGQGWIPESTVRLFSSQEKAVTASEGLTQ